MELGRYEIGSSVFKFLQSHDGKSVVGEYFVDQVLKGTYVVSLSVFKDLNESLSIEKQIPRLISLGYVPCLKNEKIKWVKLIGQSPIRHSGPSISQETSSVSTDYWVKSRWSCQHHLCTLQVPQV